MQLTKNFASEEFKCKCGKCNLEINHEFVERLQRAREIAGVRFKILSGCRCKEHNKNVGGVANSSHVFCLAADIEVTELTKMIIYKALKQSGFIRVGVANGFIHCDIDNTKPQVEWKY